jgi:membrane fusion protein, multidrug efflux system
MKKIALAVVVVGALVAGVMYFRDGGEADTQTAGDGGAPGGGAGGNGRGGRRGGGGGGFGGGGQFGRPPMTVELGKASRASIASEITVVGNLIGQTTVTVAPRAAGRLQDISVRLGDRVSRGQRVARLEDFELQEQVKQAEAAQEVSMATIRQREADLQLAQTNAERSRNLFQRQLLPKQTLDDNESRYQSAVAAVDLARAQASQSKARLDELRINLGNMIITSPVNGFVSRRVVDPGAFVSQNAPIVDVVDITTVRLVANIIEKDLKELQTGDGTKVEVDAYPGEEFMGRIARVSPVLDPATRTAPIEIEIPNPGYRLKPGMYARVSILTDTTKDALVVPSDAVVDLGGRRGVFTPLNESAVFRALQIGTEAGNIVEILGGLAEGDVVVTTGAGALRDGDRILLPGGGGRRGGTANNGAGGRGGRDGAAGTGQGRQGREGAAAGATPAPGGAAAPSGGTAAEGGRRTGGDGSGRYGGRSGEGRGGREGRLGRDGRSGTEGRAEAPPSGGPAS